MKADSHIQRRAAIKGLTPKLRRLTLRKILTVFLSLGTVYTIRTRIGRWLF